MKVWYLSDRGSRTSGVDDEGVEDDHVADDAEARHRRDKDGVEHQTIVESHV